MFVRTTTAIPKSFAIASTQFTNESTGFLELHNSIDPALYHGSKKPCKTQTRNRKRYRGFILWDSVACCATCKLRIGLFPFLMQDDNESKVSGFVGLRTPYSASRGCLANWLDAIIFSCRTAYHVVGMASFAPAKLCMSKASRRHGSMNH